MKVSIKTENAPAAIGPYSQAIKVGQFIFCSGQIPIDPLTGKVIKGEIEAQTRQVMENIKAVLNSAGASLENIIKTTIFLIDMNDFSQVNSVYGEYFPGTAPARSTVEVSALPKNVNVEIEVIAYL